MIDSKLISAKVKVETRDEELMKVTKELEDSKKEITYIQKKSLEKDEFFLRPAKRLWDFCRNYYDKFGAKPKEANWDLSDYSSFFKLDLSSI